MERARQAPEGASASAADDDLASSSERSAALQAASSAIPPPESPTAAGVLHFANGRRPAGCSRSCVAGRAPAGCCLHCGLTWTCAPRARGLCPGSICLSATARRDRPDHRTHDEHDERLRSRARRLANVARSSRGRGARLGVLRSFTSPSPPRADCCGERARFCRIFTRITDATARPGTDRSSVRQDRQLDRLVAPVPEAHGQERRCEGRERHQPRSAADGRVDRKSARATTVGA